MSNVQVFDLGGSIIVPDQVDSVFITKFKTFLEDWLKTDPARKAILVIGGGAPARKYQTAYREVTGLSDHDTQDRIGITATRLNAELLKAVFGDLCLDPVVIDPSKAETFTGKILVGAGWKPGFSTDYDAVVLAQKFGADTVLNLSNIDKVYTADPKKDPTATPIDTMSWADYKKMAGSQWIPGNNVPFDPVATKAASDAKMRVIAAAGRDLDNLQKILDGKEFTGTVIGPE